MHSLIRGSRHRRAHAAQDLRDKIVTAFQREVGTFSASISQRVAVRVNPSMIIEVQLKPEVLHWFAQHYHVRDISDPVEMGRAVMRLLKDEAKRKAEEGKQQG